MTNEKTIIKCRKCGIENNGQYIDPITRLCNECKMTANEIIIVQELKGPEDVIKLHNILEDTFGE